MKWTLIVTLLSIAGLIFYAYADSKRFWKVIDPNNPKFNIEKFCFNDYSTSDQLADVLRVLTPIGTSKEYADRILSGPHGHGGRDMTEHKDFYINYYKRYGIQNLDSLAEKTRTVMHYGDGGCRKLRCRQLQDGR